VFSFRNWETLEIISVDQFLEKLLNGLPYSHKTFTKWRKTSFIPASEVQKLLSWMKNGTCPRTEWLSGTNFCLLVLFVLRYVLKLKIFRMSKLTLNNIIRALFLGVFVILERTNFENWNQPVVSLIAQLAELVCNDKCRVGSLYSRAPRYRHP